MSCRVLIVGCGGIGGVLTATWCDIPGFRVETVTRNRDLVRHVEMHGLCCVRGRRSWSAKPSLVCNLGEAQYDLIVLTTQPTDVVEAAQTYYPRLSAAGELVVLQNGLCEARVAAALGTHAGIVGGVVAWGARTHTLGMVEQTSEGAVVFGRLDGQPIGQRDALVKLFEQIATVGFTDNLLGTRWSKLIINSVVSSLGTVNGTQLGEVVRSVQGRRVGLKILSEGVAVANAHGISLEPIAGTIDLNALAQPLSGERPRFWKNIYAHLVLCIVGFKYRKLYSSMLRALESGRAPAIDFLNGELVDAGHRAGIATPVNQAVCELVHAFAAGDEAPGYAHISALLSPVVE